MSLDIPLRSSLFAHDYLHESITRLDDWRDIDAAAFEAAVGACLPASPWRDRPNESQTEDDLCAYRNGRENGPEGSCIPSFCKHQITPKTSRYTRCSMSMFPNASINGRIRSSGQLGRWWYSISPWRNNECVRRFTVFAFNQRS